METIKHDYFIFIARIESEILWPLHYKQLCTETKERIIWQKKIDHRVGPDGRPDVMTTHPPELLKWRFRIFCGDLGSRTSGRPPSSPLTGQDVNHQSPLQKSSIPKAILPAICFLYLCWKFLSISWKRNSAVIKSILDGFLKRLHFVCKSCLQKYDHKMLWLLKRTS